MIYFYGGSLWILQIGNVYPREPQGFVEMDGPKHRKWTNLVHSCRPSLASWKNTVLLFECLLLLVVLVQIWNAYTAIHVYIYTHTCTYKWICRYIYIYAHTCTYKWICMCLYICIYSFIYIHILQNIFMCFFFLVCVFAYVCICMSMSFCVRCVCSGKHHASFLRHNPRWVIAPAESIIGIQNPSLNHLKPTKTSLSHNILQPYLSNGFFSGLSGGYQHFYKYPLVI